MKQTPQSLRRHIALTGKTNAGKSSLFNALIGHNTAIVSEKHGTTTDPVIKSMELLPYGPVTLVDTAGMGDITELGEIRMQGTKKVLRRCDLVLHVSDASAISKDDRPPKGFPVIRVFTKCDLIEDKTLKVLKENYPDAVFLYQNDRDALEDLKKRMMDTLLKLDENRQETLVGELLPRGSKLILVIPIDSEAPKGRLILPQVQLLRDVLDNGMLALVTRETELSEALERFPPDLVVTDSQVFSLVNELVPKDIPLTSFSMLLAYQKANFHQLLSGTRHIGDLKDGANILMLEGCTHNRTHEDIGRNKIPKLLKRFTGKELRYTYHSGYDFPEYLNEFDLIIQCGGCMLSQKELENRLKQMKEQGTPVTNYGMALAFCNGILDRASGIFLKR